MTRNATEAEVEHFASMVILYEKDKDTMCMFCLRCGVKTYPGIRTNQIPMSAAEDIAIRHVGMGDLIDEMRASGR